MLSIVKIPAIATCLTREASCKLYISIYARKIAADNYPEVMNDHKTCVMNNFYNIILQDIFISYNCTWV